MRALLSWFLILGSITTLLLGACAQDEPTASPTPSVTAIRGPQSFPGPTTSIDEILELSRLAMDQVQSCRYSGEFIFPDRNKAGDIVNETTQVSGEWTAAGGWYLRSEGLLDGRTWVTESVLVDQLLLTRDSGLGRGEGEWREGGGAAAASAYLPTSCQNVVGPGNDLTLFDVDNLLMLPDEAVEGHMAFHITSVRETVYPWPQEGFEPDPMIVTTSHFFISREDYRLLRLTIDSRVPTFPSTDAGGEGEREVIYATRQVTWDFYDFNAPIVIDVPELG